MFPSENVHKHHSLDQVCLRQNTRGKMASTMAIVVRESDAAEFPAFLAATSSGAVLQHGVNRWVDGFFEVHQAKHGVVGPRRVYLIGREPVIRMSTSLLALCCQSGPEATWETPISARSRSNGSRSLRISPLFMAAFTSALIAPET